MKLPAFSFQYDVQVPGFDTQKHLIVFDEVCVLCNNFAGFVARYDEKNQFVFTSAQSDLGQALYTHYDLPTDAFETNLVIIDGIAYQKLYSFVAVMRELGGICKCAGVLHLLPRPVADWLYDRIARNRYAIFGKHDHCPVPTAAMKARLL